jgi:hypothetical protein
MSISKVTSISQLEEILKDTPSQDLCLEAKVLTILRQLYLKNFISPYSFILEFLNCSERKLNETLTFIFSPVQVNIWWEAAMNNNAHLLREHPFLVEKIKAMDLSYADQEQYFIDLELSKGCILEYRYFCITHKKIREMINSPKN